MMVNICVPEFTKGIKSIVRELRENRSSFKIWLPQEAYNDSNKNVRYWKDIGQLEKRVTIDKRFMCFEWNVDSANITRREDIYRYCVEHSTEGGCWVVLTEEKYSKGQITFFLDSKEDVNYPEEWIHLFCFDNAETILNFCGEIENAYSRLSNNPQFVEAHDNFKHTRGAQVYKEKKTECYWYLDTFHRNHFEVFDKFGKKHLGEADVKTLQLRNNSADPKKKPIL